MDSMHKEEFNYGYVGWFKVTKNIVPYFYIVEIHVSEEKII